MNFKFTEEEKNWIFYQWHKAKEIRKYLSVYRKRMKKKYNIFPNVVQMIKKFKNEIGYKNFLKTCYWRTFTFKAKIMSRFTCSECGSKKNLQSHHPNYNRLGREHKNISHLQVLCGKCHAIKHGIMASKETLQADRLAFDEMENKPSWQN